MQIQSPARNPNPDMRYQSIFTKVKSGLFQYEILPFIEHPKDILVLRCVNKDHY